MKRLLLMTVLLVALLALVFGCSDDEETPTGGTELAQGDTNNPGFQFVDSALEVVMFDWFDQTMDLAGRLMDSVPGQANEFHKAAPMAGLGANWDEELIVTAIIHFDYTETGWFVFQFEAIAIGPMDLDTTEISGIDSIQWLREGVPFDTLSYGVEPDALKTRAHFGWSRGDAASGASHQRVDLETEIVSEGLVPVGGDTMLVINAAVHDTVEISWSTDTTSCTLDMASSTTVTDIKTPPGDDEEDGCPESGAIAASAAVQFDCTGSGAGWWTEFSIDGSWTATITFIGDNMATAHYSDGTTVWTMTGPCD